MKKQFVSPTIEIKQLTTTNLLANSDIKFEPEETTDYMESKENAGWDFEMEY